MKGNEESKTSNDERKDKNRKCVWYPNLLWLSGWIRNKDHESIGDNKLYFVGMTFAAAIVALAYRKKKRISPKLMSSIYISIISQWKRIYQLLRRQFENYRLISHTHSPYLSGVWEPLSLLWTEAKLGRIEKALLGADSVAYQVKGQWKRSSIPSTNLHSTLLETLTTYGCSDVSKMPESIWSRLATPALTALPFVYLYFVYRMLHRMTGGDDKVKPFQVSNVSRNLSLTTFDDIAGMDSAVREVSELVTYLRDPHVYRSIGARPPRGILLHGPPGTGKTLLARAIAGEANAACFLACSGSEFVDTYVGRGASRIRQLFTQIRALALRTESKTSGKSKICPQPPCAILFLDEIDAVAKTRSSSSYSGGSEERDQTLNQLLTCMDGFVQYEDSVTLIVIAATNRPEVLDPALLRRMDRHVHIGLPNALGRQAIFKVHAKRIQCEASKINWAYLAQRTENFSGADLRNVVNESAMLAVRQRSDVVQQHHFLQAIEKIQATKISSRVPIQFHQGLPLR
jgi:ATP-dependent Zn protease